MIRPDSSRRPPGPGPWRRFLLPGRRPRSDHGEDSPGRFPLTPNDRDYWEQPSFQEFPKALFRFATTPDGRVKLQSDRRPELDDRTVATSGEEAHAKADGWDNLQAAHDAAMRALQEQDERDRDAEDRRYIEDRKRLKRLDEQADLEMRGGPDQVLTPTDESRAGKNLTEPHDRRQSSGEVRGLLHLGPSPQRVARVEAHPVALGQAWQDQDSRNWQTPVGFKG